MSQRTARCRPIRPLGPGVLKSERTIFSVGEQALHAFGPVGRSMIQRLNSSSQMTPASQMCEAISFGFMRIMMYPAMSGTRTESAETMTCGTDVGLMR